VEQVNIKINSLQKNFFLPLSVVAAADNVMMVVS